MSTRVIVRQIAPPSPATASAPAMPPVRMPHAWLAITVAAIGYLVYIGGIALFSSVASVLAGIGLIVLSLAFYLGAVLNAYARWPREVVANAQASAESVSVTTSPYSPSPASPISV